MRNLTVDAARALMLAKAARLGVETVSIEEAQGRVLAEPVRAVRHQPPFDASAMDGWAVRRGDGEGARRIAGESAAGRGYPGVLQAGEAVRIFTGAPVPAGADLVVIQEEAERDGDVVRVGDLTNARGNIRPAGGDFRSSDVLLEAGARLDPWNLSLAAAAGAGTLKVARKPAVAVLATGEELVAPGQAAGPHQIFESGSHAVVALVRAWGGEARRLPAARDDVDGLVAALNSADADLVVTIGGASVGDYDLVKTAVNRIGFEQSVETIKIRPGKPTWFGVMASGSLLLGLPGNPASALVCAELFLRPLIAALQGVSAEPALTTARTTKALPAEGPRDHYQRARLLDGTVELFSDQDSSLVSVFAKADALVVRPANAPAAEAGEEVRVLRLDRL